MIRKLVPFAVILAVATASCGPSVSPVTGQGGEKIFEATCVSCHGPDGSGLDGLGKPLQDNELMSELSDSELIRFIKEGRGAGDPANTTGVDMPKWGGDTRLSEQDLVDLVGFLRTL